MTRILLCAFLFSKLVFVAHGVDHLDLKYDMGYNAIICHKEVPVCSGTLISLLWSITSASCVEKYSPADVETRVGNPYRKEGTFETIFTKRIIVHPGFKKKENMAHDIALLQMRKPFQDSRFVYVCKIPRNIYYWTPDSLTNLSLSIYKDIKGEERSLEKALWRQDSQIIHPLTCFNRLHSTYFVKGKNTCATYTHKNGDNKCKLDMGLPLVYEYSLVGILAYKRDCGEKDGVATFVNIPLHSRWIRQTTRKWVPWIKL